MMTIDDSEILGKAFVALPELDIVTDPDAKRSVAVQGDNLTVLSAILPAYRGKVDVIYIDPPYNTGRRFRYGDNRTETDWLGFMRLRLALARDFLAPDGVIFVSIDDHEYVRLRLLMDEIYGEENAVGPIVWKSGGGKNDSRFLSLSHEYVLAYKRPSLRGFRGVRSDDGCYRHIDENGRRYCLRSFVRQGLEYHLNLDYPILAPDGTLIYPGGDRDAHLARQNGDHRPKDWRWTLSQREFERRKAAGRIEFRQVRGVWKVYDRSYLDEKDSPRRTIYENASYADGDRELREMFRGEKVFEHPKPTTLVADLIALHPKKDALVMDFFAGSGTTGHAVLKLNRSDGGSRRFIVCTSNENGIFERVLCPRIRMAVLGYTTPKGKWVGGLGGNVSFYRTA